MRSLVIILAISALCLWGLETRYFPGFPVSADDNAKSSFLKAENWTAQEGIDITSDADGLIVNCRNQAYNGSKAETVTHCPVAQNSFLLVTLKYNILEALPCAEANLLVKMFDENGTQLKQAGLGLAQNVPPEFNGWAEECISMPANCKSVSAELYFYGNPMTVRISDLQFTAVEKSRTAYHIHPSRPPFKDDPLDDSALTAYLEKRPLRRTSVQRQGDMVQYCLDGIPTPLKIYKNTQNTTVGVYPNHLKKTPYMQKVGFNLFTVTVELGVPGHIRCANTVWLDEGKYQIEVIQKTMRELLKYAPDADVMLELVVTPHPGWAEEHPDDIVQYSDGRKAVFNGTRIHELTNEPPENYVPNKREPWTMSYWIPSYYSDTYKRDLFKALREIFQQLEKTPEAKALAGVFLCCGVDGQWFDLLAEIPATADSPALYPMADYSPAAQKHFTDYLKKTYHNSIDELKEAWQDTTVKSFDEIKIPAYEELFPQDSKLVIRKQAGHDKVIDYLRSVATGLAEIYIGCCQAIKEGSNSRFIVGGYKTDAACCSWPFVGHNCSKLMYDSPYVDFFASCPGGRTPIEPVSPYLLNGSMRMHDKLTIAELDFRTPWNGNWGEWGEPIYYKTHDEKEFQQRTMRAQLWASANGGAFHAYDMDGFWYDTPMARKAWENNNRIYDMRRPDKLSLDKIALIFSERYWDFMALNGSRAAAHIVKNQPRQAAMASGVPADMYLLDDVFSDAFEAPKVLWFVTAPEMTPEMAQRVREKYGNSGRVIVWTQTPGFGVTTDVSKVAGFKLKREPQADGKPVVALPDCKHPLLEGVSGLLMFEHSPYALGPAWAVADKDATILGTYYQTDIPAMAVKEHGDYTEIYLGQGGIGTPALARNIAKAAGAHCWNQTCDPVALAGDMLFVSAASGGKKEISIPENYTQVECITGQNIDFIDGKVSCIMEYGDILALKLIKK